MHRDGVLGTFAVATVLCVVCSVFVSSAAVGLRPFQEANKKRYRQQNILIAAGLADPSKTVAELFKSVETQIIDLESGDRVADGVVDPETYDQENAAKDPKLSVTIDADDDIAGIKRREKFSRVYLVKDGDKLEKVVLPVYGKGLWSTLRGFIALEADLDTVAGLTFYEHGETPGLGGEVDNPAWKAKWPGKRLTDDEGELQIEVVKGAVVQDSPHVAHQIDGLSGATITSRGVSNLVRYWVSEDGFGPFLMKLKQSLEGGNG
jgi:Na+-transporting NADH:ubiquinone oxidoreductase subunit C